MPKGNPNVAQFYSIFGEAEAFAARVMIDEGLARELPGPDSLIPAECKVDEFGQKASMFVIIKNKDMARFEYLTVSYLL